MNNSLTDKRNKRYGDYVNAITPTTSFWKSLWNSFWIGGLTCCIGQGVFDIFKMIFPSMSQDMLGNITSMILISVAILFTGFGFYDVIARRGGAGSFLPITGFANAMSSASMEFKTEGLIFGPSVELFCLVGPGVVHRISWSSAPGRSSCLIL